jgi:hypothetical protein
MLLVCERKAGHIEQTETSLDAELILRAAAKATALWEDDINLPSDDDTRRWGGVSRGILAAGDPPHQKEIRRTRSSAKVDRLLQVRRPWASCPAGRTDGQRKGSTAPSGDHPEHPDAVSDSAAA